MAPIRTLKRVWQNLTLHDEDILVVKREAIFFNHKPWHGLLPVDFEPYLKVIQEKKEFLPREYMETDPNYKQVIPYLIFTYKNRYFLMQRRSNASEKRLQSKFSLGIGGHIRAEDLQNDSIFEWARREFHEEVNYAGSLDIMPLGIINDDTDDVGKVHLGFVLLLQGDCPDITIKSELKSGELITLEECALHYEAMENWSKLVFDYLRKK